MSIDINNYNNFNDIPYLNNLPSSQYHLESAIDISNEKLYKSLNQLNEKTKDYLNEYVRQPPPENDNVLDTVLYESYQLNNELLVEKSENEIQFVKSISNRLKNMKNVYNNNRLVDQILNGNAISQGEIENINEQIEKRKENIDVTNRRVKISEYFHKKRLDQIRILKNCFFMMIFLFLVSVLYKVNFIHENLFVGFVGFTITIMIVYVLYELLIISSRDNNVYDEYSFSYLKGYSSKDGYNKYDKKNLELHRQKDKKKICNKKIEQDNEDIDNEDVNEEDIDNEDVNEEDIDIIE